MKKIVFGIIVNFLVNSQKLDR